MSRSLMPIMEEMQPLVDALAAHDDPDSDEVKELVEKLLDLQTERDKKIDGYCGVLRWLKAHADFRKAEAKRVSDEARIFENQYKRLKERLQYAMEEGDIGKVETKLNRVSIVNNGGKQPVEVSEGDVPEEYMVYTPTIDKTAIYDDLIAGKELPFAKLLPRGKSIRIK